MRAAFFSTGNFAFPQLYSQCQRNPLPSCGPYPQKRLDRACLARLLNLRRRRDRFPAVRAQVRGTRRVTLILSSMTGSSSAIAKNTKVLRSSLANRLSDYEPIIAGLCGRRRHQGSSRVCGTVQSIHRKARASGRCQRNLISGCTVGTAHRKSTVGRQKVSRLRKNDELRSKGPSTQHA